MALMQMRGGGIKGNYLSEGDEYWISSPKKRGSDRIYSSAVNSIEKSAVDEYLEWTGAADLDRTYFKVIDD